MLNDLLIESPSREKIEEKGPDWLSVFSPQLDNKLSILV